MPTPASYAFIFPGQGSQAPGMGKSLFDAEPAARARFEQADDILGLDCACDNRLAGRALSQLCFEGPEDELKQTENAQPALYVCAAAACDVLRARGIAPACVAGHSLGEYAALYAAGVVDFETGLRLVAVRGRAMAEASRAMPGAMAAILGLDVAQVEAICAAASGDDGTVVLANDNAPGQIVISGTTGAVERACAAAKSAGAKRALPLPVSGGFHSPLVEPARRVMAEELANATLHSPKCPLIQNFTARAETDPEAIRRNLIEQVTGRVRWVESVRTMKALGIAAALEVGPGKVLAGLVKRIEPTLEVSPAGTAEDIGQVAGK